MKRGRSAGISTCWRPDFFQGIATRSDSLESAAAEGRARSSCAGGEKETQAWSTAARAVPRMAETIHSKSENVADRKESGSLLPGWPDLNRWSISVLRLAAETSS